jgi:3-methyladenine DNA glycosylase/8-oxoguanine DNA glycosylase
MITHHLQISVPRDFNFWSAIYSHGWCVLPPFSIQKEEGTFSRIITLDNNLLVECTMRDGGGGIAVLARCSAPLTPAHRTQIRKQLRQCLRLDEDFSTFYTEARRLARFRWIVKAGAGRMLRAPTVFEDLVKMICTTNCSWSLTESMVDNLTTQLGQKFDDGKYSFPAPETIAGKTDAFLRKHIRAGYRSPYLLELSDNVASGRIDLESWRSSRASTEDLFTMVRSVKGAGDYAAGNLLKLLGRYDYLGLDSWVRSTFYDLHTKGRRVKDSTIEKHYAPLGRFRGLFFWLEMTRHWYKKKFPF